MHYIFDLLKIFHLEGGKCSFSSINEHILSHPRIFVNSFDKVFLLTFTRILHPTFSLSFRAKRSVVEKSPFSETLHIFIRIVQGDLSTQSLRSFGRDDKARQNGRDGTKISALVPIRKTWY